MAADSNNGTTEVVYITLQVADATKSRDFYTAVLGWEFSGGRVEDGWNIAGTKPMMGLSGGHDRPTAVPMYRVADIDAAVARVRAAGGTATDPEPQSFGMSSDCVDDQGMRFYLGQLTDGAS